MRLSTILSASALASVSLAGVLHLDLYTDSADGNAVVDHDQKVLTSLADDAPRWKKRDERHLVPLIPGAKTGALPVEVEEGLVATLGPRFANVFIDAAINEQNGSSIAAGSCNPLKCAGTVIKAIPCITAAIACKCLDPIKNCPGVDIGALCNCIGCLPGPLQDFLKKIGICPKSIGDLPLLLPANANEDARSEYPEYVAFSTRSANLLAYRGDLSTSTLEEAKEVAQAGLCPGAPCGDCSCCLGVCVLGQCLGVCLPLSSTLFAKHQEL